MANLKIENLNPATDIDIISSWDIQFENDKRYDSIKHFILEDNIFYGLGEVINTNYEIYPIGKNERKYAFALKTSSNKLIGFILALVCDIPTPSPELIIQYIVLHPEYQNKGFGKKALSELINNSNKYLQTNIGSVFARIDITNKASLKTFNKLGFSFEESSSQFVKATYKLPENIKE